MNKASHAPAWEEYAAWIAQGFPRAFKVVVEPPLLLFIEAGGARIGLKFPLANDEAPAFGFLEIVTTREIPLAGGQRGMELAVDEPGIFREFFHLLSNIIDEVQNSGVSPLTAVEASLAAFQSLLRKTPRLGEEQVIGLIGELLAFEQLAPSLGKKTIDAWVGPDKSSHDFRFRSIELEVKATRSTQRTHMFNGLKQLVASPGCDLFILSFQLEPSGDGITLPSQIEKVRTLLIPWTGQRQRFDSQLRSKFGYIDADSQMYPQAYRIRSQPTLIPVNDECPKLTPDVINASCRGLILSHLDELHYRMKLDGLGLPLGSPQSQAFLSGKKRKIS